MLICASFVFAEEGDAGITKNAEEESASEEISSEPSILGKVLDKTLSPLDMLLAPSQRLDPIVVTPTRYKDPSLNVAGNITVITEDQIRESQAKYVPDILRKEAGIVVSDFLGNGKTTRVDMRGFGDSANQNVLVLVDGRRTNQIDLSGADWTQIDIDNIEKIEIARGPHSVLYGDNATGGVINIITKSGKKEGYEAGVKAAAGSYAYKSFKGHVSGGSDFMDFYASTSSTYNKGRRINNHLETVDYTASFTIKPEDCARLRVSTAYHKDWYGLPGAVKPMDINAIGRRGSISPDNRGKTEDWFIMGTPELELSTDFGDILISGDFMARTRHTSAIFYSQWGNSINKHRIWTVGLTPKIAFSQELFNVKNRFMAGVDYYDNTDMIHSGLESAVDVIKIRKDTLGAYVQDTIELPCSLILNVGGRAEKAYYNFNQDAILRTTDKNEPFEYAYEAGLTYKYNDKSSVYARYSRSYRLPATDEWYASLYIDYFSGLVAGGLNTDLKPQTAHNYEIGFKENSSKYIGLKGDFYVMPVKDELYYDPITYKNDIYGNTLHSGLDLEANFYLSDIAKVFGAYSYQKSYFVGGTFAGNDIPLVPKHKFSAGFELTYMDCLNLIFVSTFVGDRYFINDQLNEMPKLKHYLVHDLKMSYKKYGVEIFCALNNILDAEYSEYGALDFTRTMPGYYPSPRRNFTMGMSYKF